LLIGLKDAPGRRQAQRLWRHNGAADSADPPSMLSIAHIWSWLIHLPFLGGILVLFALWRLIDSRVIRSRPGRR